MASETPRPSTQAHADRIVASLATLPTMPYRSHVAMRFVLGIRWLAMCERKRHDPVVELTQRLGSVTAAKAFIDFADLAGRCWPEPVQVLRPCCSLMTADESLFAAMAEAAARADRTKFSAVLDGFIRCDRHERLYDHALFAVAASS
ncbi:MAG: DNA-directed RNA polymerase subunit beta' [Alteraurantiacibacter sp.]